MKWIILTSLEGSGNPVPQLFLKAVKPSEGGLSGVSGPVGKRYGVSLLFESHEPHSVERKREPPTLPPAHTKVLACALAHRDVGVG